MITKEAKKGLARILEISCPEDVKVLELKIVPGKKNSKSQEESVKAILEYVRRPSQILCRQNIKKDTLVAYLEEVGINVQEKQSKNACIIQCLKIWHMNEDISLVTERGSNEKTREGQKPRLDKYMSKEANAVSQDFVIQRKNLLDILETVEKRNASPQLNKKKEDWDEIQFLSPTTASTESSSTESVESLPISSLPSLRGISGHKSKPTSSTSSQIVFESINLTNESQSLLSESLNSFPDVFQPERNQSIPQSMPPRCFSAPVSDDNQRQLALPSKNPHSFSTGGNLPSRMLLPKPSSNEPSGFSSHSPDCGGLFSWNTMEGKDALVPGSTTSSPATSHHVCKIERESQEPLLTEPFNSSPQPTEIAIVSRMGVTKGEHGSVLLTPVTSHLSSHQMYQAERESSERPQPFTSKTTVCTAFVSDASVQTCLAEPSEFEGNGSTVRQEIHRRHIQAADKKDISAFNETLLTNKPNHMRHLHQHPEKGSTLPFDGNRRKSRSVPKRKDLSDAVPDAKRSKWTQSPTTGNYTSDSTMSECPHCGNKYSSSSFRADRKGDGMSIIPSPSRGYKKKRLSSDEPSIEIPRQPTGPSKRTKESSDVSHTCSRPSISRTNVKILKRKSVPSPSEKTLPPHGTKHKMILSSKQPCYNPDILTGHPKKTKESFKKVNSKKDHTSKLAKSKDGASLELTPPVGESPTNYLPSDLVHSPTGSSSVPPEKLSVSESKLTSPDCESDTSEETADTSTESPASPDLEKPSPPKRYCCSLM